MNSPLYATLFCFSISVELRFLLTRIYNEGVNIKRKAKLDSMDKTDERWWRKIPKISLQPADARRPSRAPFSCTIPGKRIAVPRVPGRRLVEVHKQVHLGATKSYPRLLCKSSKFSPIYTQKSPGSRADAESRQQPYSYYSRAGNPKF